MDYSIFKKSLLKKLSNYFKTEGYRTGELPETFIKSNDKYIDTIIIGIGHDKRSSLFRIKISGIRKILAIESIWEIYDNKDLNSNVTIGTNLSANDSKIEINPDTEGIVDIVFEKILKIHKSLILVKLAYYSDYSRLNDIANVPIDNVNIKPIASAGLWYRKLILAHLTGNKDFEELYKYSFDLFKNLLSKEPNNVEKQKTLIILENIYNDLKNQSSSTDVNE